MPSSTAASGNAHGSDIIILHLGLNPPTQCGSFQFSWTGGQSPFTVNINAIITDDTRELGPTNASTFVWTPVDFPALFQFWAHVSDGNGHVSNPKLFGPIQGTSLNSNCLGTLSLLVPSTAELLPQPYSLTIADAPTSSSSSITATTPSPSATMSSSLGPAHVPIRESSTTELPSVEPIPTHGKPSSTSGDDDSQSDTSLLHPMTPMGQATTSTNLPDPPSVSNHSSPRVLKHSGLAGIVVGCLVIAAFAAFAVFALRKRRRATRQLRIRSMSSIGTLDFTNASRPTTWSDLCPSEPGQPYGSNKGVTEWDPDMFAQEKRRPPQYLFSSRSAQRSSKRTPRNARVTALSTITEQSVQSNTLSDADRDDLSDTERTLPSYPPLRPQPMSPSASDQARSQYVQVNFPVAPQAVQSPKNPFRARLLAASSDSARPWNAQENDLWK